jgi:hypothetical protein
MRSRVLSAALTIAGLVLLFVAATLTGSHIFGYGQAGRALSSAPLPPSLMPAPSSTTVPTTTRAVTTALVPKSATPLPGVPVQVIVASHNVAAPVSGHPLLADGSLFVPPDPHDVSWASGDAAPGDPSGTVILTSHVNFGGVAGAFSELADYRVGQLITLVLADGRRTKYAVAAIIEVKKDELGPRRAELFDQTHAFGLPGRPRTGRLLLLSCGGFFSNATGHYDSNVFVYALPTGS